MCKLDEGMGFMFNNFAKSSIHFLVKEKKTTEETRYKLFKDKT